MDLLATKAMAMKVDMDRAISRKAKITQFESDNKDLIKMMNGQIDDLPRNNVGMTCHTMWKMENQFLEATFSHIGRINNTEAHMITKVCVTKQNQTKDPSGQNGPKAHIY